MIITVASYKGGVGKTTTAVHLAALMQGNGSTLLLDGDSTRNATRWAQRRALESGPFPFRVAPLQASAKLAHQFRHVVIDTGQKPTDEEMAALVEGCDLIVVPAVPSFLDADGLGETIRALQRLQDAQYRVLLNKVAPDAAGAAAEMRRELEGAGVPLFGSEIPRLKALEKAAGAGLIAHEVRDPNAARVWSCYQALESEISR